MNSILSVLSVLSMIVSAIGTTIIGLLILWFVCNRTMALWNWVKEFRNNHSLKTYMVTFCKYSKTDYLEPDGMSDSFKRYTFINEPSKLIRKCVLAKNADSAIGKVLKSESDVLFMSCISLKKSKTGEMIECLVH